MVFKEGLLHRVSKRQSESEIYQLVLPTKYKNLMLKSMQDCMLEEGLMPSVKHGGENVMVWECVGAGKVGHLYWEIRILNKEGYRSILHKVCHTCGQHLIGASFIQQQDKDPKNTVKLCKTYLGKKHSAGILFVIG